MYYENFVLTSIHILNLLSRISLKSKYYEMESN